MRNAARLIFVLALTALLAGVAYTSSVTFAGGSAGAAGDGVGAISGYTVSAIHHTLVDSLPYLMTTVSFQLNKPAGEVYARYELSPSGATPWKQCFPVGGNTWSCPGFLVPVASVTTLRVAAAD